MVQNDILIGVITHKAYPMPKNNIYLPIEVASAFHIEKIFEHRDNIGENIAEKNQSFCELTGIYYVYRNFDCDILGFVHYRRLFLKKGFFVKKNLDNVISRDEIVKKLNSYDFILPKKRHYYIENNYKHYIGAHKKEALDKTKEIIDKYYPTYSNAFNKQMKKRSCHLFNMFIAKKNVADNYLNWLFDVLFRLEKEINLDEYIGYDRRVFGFIAERLIDVYIMANKLTYVDQKYYFTEKQKWIKKILKFLKRHFCKNNDTTKQ